VLIRIEVAGINYIDTYHRRGLYPLPLPFTPGIEGAGVVENLGAGVEDLRCGEQVIFCLGIGGYAEYATVPAWKVVRLPSGVSTEAGVTAMCQGMTAHYLVTDSFPLGPGHWALVHAAAGGVGLLLVQMCRQLGARVIGTVSTEEKAQLAREAGAEIVVRYPEEDFTKAVREATGGLGVDVVYESVGRDTFSRSMDCLRTRGYLVLFGQSSGPVDPLDPQILNQKGSLFLTRPSLGHYVRDKAEFSARAEAVLNQIGAGALKVTVGDRLPLAEAAEAHRRLEGRRTVGKVLLIP
jgi:NADPH2:quinone reductase